MFKRRCGFAVNRSGRHAGDGDAGGDVLRYNGIRADSRIISDDQASVRWRHDLGTRADEHVVADPNSVRRADPCFRRDRNLMVKYDVPAELGIRMDDDPKAVVPQMDALLEDGLRRQNCPVDKEIHELQQARKDGNAANMRPAAQPPEIRRPEAQFQTILHFDGAFDRAGLMIALERIPSGSQRSK